MNSDKVTIAFATKSELSGIGELMADVYSELEGFPSRHEQPKYYRQFTQLEKLTKTEGTDVIVAKASDNNLLGAVVYFSDVKHYQAGGEPTTSLKNTAGIRLLAVSPSARGQGLGKKLTQHCIALAKNQKRTQMILHTTQFMPAAWHLYERMGFIRFTETDFKQEELDVFGFQLVL